MTIVDSLNSSSERRPAERGASLATVKWSAKSCAENAEMLEGLFAGGRARLETTRG
jgi:hypothetical protein